MSTMKHLQIYYSKSSNFVPLSRAFWHNLSLRSTDWPRISFCLFSVDFDAQDPRWVGAWWFGFIFTAILFIIIAIPISLYPKSMPGTCSDCRYLVIYSNSISFLILYHIYIWSRKKYRNIYNISMIKISRNRLSIYTRLVFFFTSSRG